MSRIHFVGGEKGGVGKTVLARLLCQYFLDNTAAFCALDCDDSQPALWRSYERNCRLVDLSRFASADQIMDQASSGEREVVVDLPAKSLRQLKRWLQESDVLALAAERGIEICFWYVSDGGYASARSLEEHSELLGARAQLILVRNHRWGDDFSEFEAAQTVQAAVAAGAQFVDIVGLDPALMYKLEQQGGHLGEALQPSRYEGDGLSVMDQRRLRRWLGQAVFALENLLCSSEIMENSQLPPVADKTSDEQTAMDKTPDETRELKAPEEQPEQGHAAVRPHIPPVGSSWIDGARTWTEVEPNALVHHVRFTR